MCRAENTLKCKDFPAEGQTGKGDSYTDGKTATPLWDSFVDIDWTGA
jgi:hypothetical protein